MKILRKSGPPILGLVMLVSGCDDAAPVPPVLTVHPVTQEQVQGFADLDEAPLLVDVRTREEFAAGHVPGAVNVPHTEIADRLNEVLPLADHGVVVYCRSGRRAGFAAEVLLHEGVEVGHLAGDMLGWQEAGLPVVIEGGEGTP